MIRQASGRLVGDADTHIGHQRRVGQLKLSMLTTKVILAIERTSHTDLMMYVRPIVMGRQALPTGLDGTMKSS